MRLLVIVLVGFVGFFALAQPQPLSTLAKEALRQGNKTVVQALLEGSHPFIDQPLWREAIGYGLRAKDAAPVHPEPYSYLAKVYNYVKFYDAAWNAYSSFRALGGIPDERQRQAIIQLGRTLGYEFFAREDFTSALSYYLVAHNYAPDDRDLNLQIARSYLGTNQANLASAYLRRLDANHSEDYSRYLETAHDQLFYGQSSSNAYERGIKQYYLGNFSDARDSFAQATQLDPTFQKAYVWAGRISLELSQPELALPYWQQALALQPGNADMQYFLTLTENQLRWGIPTYRAFEQGMMFYNQGNLSDARASLEQAVAQNPNFSDAWAWLGRIAYEGADYQTAYTAFGKAKILAKNETYEYFYKASARQLGINTVVTREVATLEQAAPIRDVKRLETVTENLTIEQPVIEQSVIEQPLIEETFTEQIAIENQRETEVTLTKNPIPEVTLAESVPVEIPVAEVTITKTVTDIPNPFRSDLPSDVVTPENEATVTESATTDTIENTTSLDSLLTESSLENIPSTEQLILLNTTYTYERPAIEDSGAVSFFAASEEVRQNWQTPTNYAAGVVYQRLEVSRKPSNEIVTYQLCLVPNDDISVKPTCSRARGLEFKDIGVYEAQQSLSEFYQYSNIDWRKGISNLMVILRDENGNPIDAAFARESGHDLDLYYPMNVRYSVVLVPPGGKFRGWP
jgi:tetratricopeptide (TPR) repeat protein